MEFDFAQNTKVADINKIPADFRGLYKEVAEGDSKQYVLNSEDAGVKSAVAAITGLNSALKAARGEVKTLKSGQVDLTPLQEYGADPAAIAAKVKEIVEGLQGQIKGVNVDKIKQDLEKPWTEKLTKAEEKAKKAEASFHKRVVVGEAKAAIATLKGDPDLLLPFVLQHCKVVTNAEGELDVVVVDDQGDIRHSGVTGKPMSISERVAEMKGLEKFGKLFASEAPAGGGAAPGSTSRPNGAIRPGGQQNTQEMTPNQKIAAGLNKGLATKGRR